MLSKVSMPVLKVPRFNSCPWRFLSSPSPHQPKLLSMSLDIIYSSHSKVSILFKIVDSAHFSSGSIFKQKRVLCTTFLVAPNFLKILEATSGNGDLSSPSTACGKGGTFWLVLDLVKKEAPCFSGTLVDWFLVFPIYWNFPFRRKTWILDFLFLWGIWLISCSHFGFYIHSEGWYWFD